MFFGSLAVNVVLMAAVIGLSVALGIRPLPTAATTTGTTAVAPNTTATTTAATPNVTQVPAMKDALRSYNL